MPIVDLTLVLLKVLLSVKLAGGLEERSPTDSSRSDSSPPSRCPPVYSPFSDSCCRQTAAPSRDTSQFLNALAKLAQEAQNSGREKKKIWSSYHDRRQIDPTPEEVKRLTETLLFIEATRAGSNVARPRPPRQALPRPLCDPNRRFRSADGTCNHDDQPLLGAAGQIFTRLTPATYQDGVFSPRVNSVVGPPLPSARRVSRLVTSSRDVTNSLLTMSVMQWGQFLDHDLAMSPQVKLDTTCCINGTRRTSGEHPFCFPIDISPGDPHFSTCEKTCMEFVRSVPAWDPKVKQLTQMNTRTSYVDADMIYGVGERWTEELRERAGGRLKVNSRKFLLPDPAPEMCFSAYPLEPCFRSGDIRVNVQVGLMVMHTIWMREHNRIAGRLSELNPHWGEEQLFQEARRVVIAEIQHITYGEWLPIVLGQNFTTEGGIGNPDIGDEYSDLYADTMDPTVSTEFSTAAFRFGHSLVNSIIHLVSDLRAGPFGFAALKDVFFNPHLIYQGATELLAAGLVLQTPQMCDTNFASDLTGHLFQEPGQTCGMDLVALNIQRGRDHGIPTYVQARRWCRLSAVESFDQLLDDMTFVTVVRLAEAYRSVKDIDLFIGAIAELPAPGAVTGPTFQCLIGDQFFRMRWGDNFFYDLGGEQRPWRFTLPQLHELRKTSWARVLCDTVSSIREIQPQAFRTVDLFNPLIACSELPEVNLTHWRESLGDEEHVKSEKMK